MIHSPRSAGRWCRCMAVGVALAFGTATADSPVATVSTPPQLATLIAEAIANNPEFAAAWSEFDAARQRIAPAGAFEDPMLEAGVINAPFPSLNLQREEMTMKMLGLGQKLPYPGTRFRLPPDP